MNAKILRGLCRSFIPLVAAAAIGGCSGGGSSSSSPDTPNNPQLTGVVSAPGGTVAKFQQRGPFYALMDMLFGPAQAATTGLAVVPGATVQLVHVDAGGNATVLVTTTTNSKGRYVITIPAGQSLSPTLMVRVLGSGTLKLRAPAVQNLVDVTPASEYLVRKLMNDPGLLVSVTKEDVLVLQTLIDSFNIDATAAGDVEAAITAIGTNLDTIVDDEITVITTTGGVTPPVLNGTSWRMNGNDLEIGSVAGGNPVSGVWLSGSTNSTLSTNNVTLTQVSGNAYNVAVSYVEKEASSFAHGMDCQSYSGTSVSGCTFNGYNTTSDPFFQTHAEGPFTFPTGITPLADGRLMISHPAEEYTEATSQYVYVTPALTDQFMPMGTNAYAGIASRPGFVYAKVDGVADYNQMFGGSGESRPASLIKVGSGLTNAVANGTYGMIVWGNTMRKSGDRSHNAMRATVTLNGSGGVMNGGTVNGVELHRTAEPSATVYGVAPPTATITAGDYTVAGDGTFALNVTATGMTDPPAFTGTISSDGGFFFVGETVHVAPPTVETEEVRHTSGFAIRTGTDAPSLANKTFRFEAFNVEYGDGTGNQAHTNGSHVTASSITFVDATNVNLHLNTQGIERISDITSVSANSNFDKTETGTYTVDVNGVFTITLSGSNRVVHGFVSENGNAFLGELEFGAFPFTAGDTAKGSVGIVMGMCSTGC